MIHPLRPVWGSGITERKERVWSSDRDERGRRGAAGPKSCHMEAKNKFPLFPKDVRGRLPWNTAS